MGMLLTKPRPEVHHEQVPESPDPQVPDKARRRRFTAEYKARIVAEAEACNEPGQIGALLRREGIYSSNLAEWRRQAKQEGFTVLSAAVAESQTIHWWLKTPSLRSRMTVWPAAWNRRKP